MTEHFYDVEMSSKFPIKMWTRGVQVEDAALQQLRNTASLPFIYKHVAVMPDVHWGMGATVGSVVATKRAVIPAAVGVDIGCGMAALRTVLTASDLPDDLGGIRSAIEAAVPHGRTEKGGVLDLGAFGPDSPRDLGAELSSRLKALVEKHPRLERASRRAPHHLGTLGTGNHFIEVCLDEKQRVWVMLHSGSRGIGNNIGQHFIEVAKKDMERWFVTLPDKDLAYLAEGTQNFDDYIEAVGWAQDFAAENRIRIMRAVVEVLDREFERDVVDVLGGNAAINCHHNYVARENHFGENVFVTRKGAVRARAGDLGIIPGSMGARSFIVRGKGNPESFCSCSHGAGRRMSRTEAKRVFTLEDHVKATEGVECRKDEGVIDETPGAYKDVDAVMAAQSDLVEVVYALKQVVCVKG